MFPITRWTPFVYLFPGRYVEPGSDWESFDLESWASEFYDWKQDAWNGLRDFAQRPAKTVDKAKGDCEDFALVAASWALSNDHDEVGLAFCLGETWPIPRHVIAYDTERVYSSGSITKESVAEYIDRTKYSRALKRDLT